MTDEVSEPHSVVVGVGDPLGSKTPQPPKVVGIDVNDEGAEDTFQAGKIREGQRTKLSWAVFILLGLVAAVYIITALAASDTLWNRASWPIGTVLTAFVGLAGTTVGFYFGSNRD